MTNSGFGALIVLIVIIFFIFILTKPQPRFDIPITENYDFEFSTRYGPYDYPYGGIPPPNFPYLKYWNIDRRAPGWRREWRW